MVAPGSAGLLASSNLARNFCNCKSSVADVTSSPYDRWVSRAKCPVETNPKLWHPKWLCPAIQAPTNYSRSARFRDGAGLRALCRQNIGLESGNWNLEMTRSLLLTRSIFHAQSQRAETLAEKTACRGSCRARAAKGRCHAWRAPRADWLLDLHALSHCPRKASALQLAQLQRLERRRKVESRDSRPGRALPCTRRNTGGSVGYGHASEYELGLDKDHTMSPSNSRSTVTLQSDSCCWNVRHGTTAPLQTARIVGRPSCMRLHGLASDGLFRVPGLSGQSLGLMPLLANHAETTPNRPGSGFLIHAADSRTRRSASQVSTSWIAQNQNTSPCLIYGSHFSSVPGLPGDRATPSSQSTSSPPLEAGFSCALVTTPR